jgi:hypothetical protein
LESAPTSIRLTVLYCYNLASYETEFGNFDKAKLLFTECFVKEPRYREESLDDPDLEPLWMSE